MSLYNRADRLRQVMKVHSEKSSFSSDSLKKLIVDAGNKEILDIQLEALKEINKIISGFDDYAVDQLIVNGILPVILSCAKQVEYLEVQRESALILNNILAGRADHLKLAVEAGALPILLNMLNSSSPEICEKAAIAFTNTGVCGSSVYLQDAVESGLVQALIALYERFNNYLTIKRNVSCNLRYICQKISYKSTINDILPVIKTLLTDPDMETKLDALYAVTHLTMYDSNVIQLLIDRGIIAQVIPCLTSLDVKLLAVALRAIGNTLVGTEAQAQYVLHNNVLKYMPSLLTHTHNIIRKASLWCMTGLLGNNECQIQAVINAGLLPKIIKNLQDTDFDIKKEATWALFNLTAIGSRDQVWTVIKDGSISPLCALLKCYDEDLLDLSLQVIAYIIENAGALITHVVSLIKMCKITERLQQLIKHKCEQIQSLAREILKKID
ncbi:importin subunit alpha-3-like [Teleopsis dalmanni]|uniref:importin subunit alpha-3-like n=1 Tax=Teleopsis dalmanni TaxID=139649 RepID=UPI0018CF9668|nr:importin subunit alpha-3-like [Teleopsis dalmanni]